MGLGEDFLSEFLGTATLTLFGCGVVANVLLGKSKGYDGGWLLIRASGTEPLLRYYAEADSTRELYARLLRAEAFGVLRNARCRNESDPDVLGEWSAPSEP